MLSTIIDYREIARQEHTSWWTVVKSLALNITFTKMLFNVVTSIRNNGQDLLAEIKKQIDSDVLIASIFEATPQLYIQVIVLLQNLLDTKDGEWVSLLSIAVSALSNTSAVSKKQIERIKIVNPMHCRFCGAIKGTGTKAQPYTCSKNICKRISDNHPGSRLKDDFVAFENLRRYV